MTTSRPGGFRGRAAAAIALVALSTLAATMSQGRIPDKKGLIDRVNLLYQAYRNRDKQAFKGLIHPQIVGCIPNLDASYFKTWDSPDHLEIVSWEVRSIQAREDPRKQPIEACKGETLRGDATALVFIGQVDRNGHAEPATTVVTKSWVHVDGQWFWLAPLE